MSRIGRVRRWTNYLGRDAMGRASVVGALALVILVGSAAVAAETEPPSSTWSPPAGPTFDAPPERLPTPTTPLAGLYAAADTAPETLPPGNAVPSPAPAFAPPAPEQPTAEQIEAIMQRLDALEKNVDKPAEEKKSSGDAAPIPEITWTDISADKWTVKPALRCSSTRSTGPTQRQRFRNSTTSSSAGCG